MPNPLDQVTEDQSQDPPLRRVYINGDGMPSDTGSAMQPALSPDNRLVQAVAPAEPSQLEQGLAALKEYLTNPTGFSSGTHVGNRLTGAGGEQRYQTWPERMIREGLTAPGDVLARTEPSTSESLIEPAMATSALAGGSALAERPGTATLGSGPVRPGMKPVVPTEPAPVFYSALEHATTNAAQDTMSPQQWLGYLKNQPGVKKEELDWTGLEGWLGQQKGKVKKEDVQTYLDAHKTEIKDVTKTGRPQEEPGDYDEHSMNLSEEHASQVMKEEFDKLPARERAKYNNDVDEWISAEGNEHLLDRHGDIASDWLDEHGNWEGGDAISTEGGPKYADYQLPGGENYREHLLTMPRPKGDPTAFAKKMTDKYGGDNYYNKMTPEERAEFDKVFDGVSIPSKNDYRSSHWDEPNVLAHVRTNDRTMPGEPIKPMSDADALAAAKDWVKHGGEKWENVSPERQEAWIDQVKKVAARKEPEPVKSLHIEEIQSDWHQQGRKQGYKSNIAPEEAKAAKQEYGEASYALEKGLAKLDPSLDYRKIGTIKGNLFNEVYRNATPTDHGAKSLVEQTGRIYGPEAAELAERFVKATAEKRRTDMALDAGVPDAPFKTTWPELALKRMIRHAAENGYDRISWTPGEAQAARYDLSKQLNLISGMKQPDGKYLVYIEGKEGQPWQGPGFSDHGQKSMTPAELEATIGKEPAKKIIEGKPNKEGWVDLRDDNLRIGGEGMREFYDKMLPKMAEKIGKTHGVKVKTGEVNSGLLHAYEGPELSPKQLHDMDGVAKRLWPVQVRTQLHDVANAVENGMPFRQAMDVHGSAMLAEKVGGKQVQKPKGGSVHYFDLPQSLKDHAVGKGFPLYMSGLPFPLTPVDHDPFSEGESKTAPAWPGSEDDKMRAMNLLHRKTEGDPINKEASDWLDQYMKWVDRSLPPIKKEKK